MKNRWPNGKGKLSSPDGYTYEGDFVLGNSTGYGTETAANGTQYVGYFKDNKRHGRGRCIIQANGKEIDQKNI